jgi:hypothetical protein
MFNQHSFLVKLYARKISNGEITLIAVPELFNLKDEVMKLV